MLFRSATILFSAIPPGRAFLFALVAVVVAIVFFSVAMRTGALRDKEPPGPDIKQPSDRAYSLSRCQIAAWTVLVLLAYLFIWILTGAYTTTISASAVILMGISFGTYAAAAVVDSGKVKSNREKLAKIRAGDRKSTRLNSSHIQKSRMPSSA